MKKIFLFFVSCFSAFLLFAQTPCEGYFPFKEGLKYEHTAYDKFGEVSNVMQGEIIYVDPLEEGGWEAEITTTIFDFDGEELSSSGSEVTCKNGAFHFSAMALLNPALLDDYVTMDVKTSGEGITLPLDLESQRNLEDGYNEMEISSSGVKLITLRFEPINRKVTGNETITTPAGEFECVKVTYDLAAKILIPKNFKVTDWYAKGIGLIKQEIRNKKGKLTGSMELTKLEQE